MKQTDEVIRWGRPIELVKSPKGTLRCTQASMIMAIKTTLGREISMEEAERLSGYIEGRETWPYQMMLSLADLGLHVTSIETLNPEALVADFEREERRVLGDNEEVIQYILSITDIPAETKRIKTFIDHPNASFEVRAPTVDDLHVALKGGALPLVSLDYGVLHQTGEGYEGHMVVVSGVGPDYVEVFDPGPPGDIWNVPIGRFQAALDSPTEGTGAMVMLRPPSGR